MKNIIGRVILMLLFEVGVLIAISYQTNWKVGVLLFIFHYCIKLEARVP